MFPIFKPLRLFLVLSVFFQPSMSIAAPAQAPIALEKHTIVDPGYVYDEFKKLDFKAIGDTGDSPYWWVINNGDNVQTYANCGDATCATGEKEQSLKYARLQLLHDATPAVWDGLEYNGVEISEYRTMYSSALPGRWLPTYGHPVTVTAVVRFSSNYLQNGTGGAVGSTGLWLWNSYPDPVQYVPVKAFGFNWAESGAAGMLGGLQMSAFQDSYPIYNQAPTLSLNMAAWHTWSFVWSANTAGAQSVTWSVDGVTTGQTALEAPFPALSLAIWNDNQYPTFLEGGQYAVVYHNPSSVQNFDIDSIEISQPQ
jgi:hypothetical protein